MRVVLVLPDEPVVHLPLKRPPLAMILSAAVVILALVAISLGAWRVLRPRIIQATSPNQLLWTWNVTTDDGRVYRIEVRGDHIVVPIEFRDMGENQGYHFNQAIGTDGVPIADFYIRTHPITIDGQPAQQTCILVPGSWSLATEWPPPSEKVTRD